MISEGFWSEWGDSNARSLEPKSSAIPPSLHPDIQLSAMIAEEKRKSKFFVSVGIYVVKGEFGARICNGRFQNRLPPQRLPGLHIKTVGCRTHLPKPPVLPTAPHPDIEFLILAVCGQACGQRGIWSGDLRRGSSIIYATVPAASGIMTQERWIAYLYSQIWCGTNSTIPKQPNLL